MNPPIGDAGAGTQGDELTDEACRLAAYVLTHHAPVGEIKASLQAQRERGFQEGFDERSQQVWGEQKADTALLREALEALKKCSAFHGLQAAGVLAKIEDRLDLGQGRAGG